MNNRQIETDDRDDRESVSDEYLSKVLEIDSAIAQGVDSELEPAVLNGLSGDEVDKLLDARKCLELLYDTSLLKRLQARAVAPAHDCREVDDDTATDDEESFASDLHDEKSSHETRMGRFHVVRAIGRGGHGVVFLARDPTLNRFVALKVPHPEILLTPSMRRRFLAEGKASALLTHPNIVTVYEAGEIGPVCYLAQEYITGSTLSEWLHREPALPAPHVAAAIVAQLADGIDHAHKRGVLHRDLKPGNVLLQAPSGERESGAHASPDGLRFVPKIMDFGVAKSLESDGDDTATGTILGTAAYMSPEQANGQHRRVGPSTDVYGLGAILYELLTRQTLFQGESRIDTLRLVTSAEPVLPRKLRRDIPRDLESICLKCLEKDPVRRYASAFELAADLRRFLSGEATVARPISSTERAMRWCRRRPAAASLIGVSIVATVALLGVVLWSKYQLEDLLVEAKRQRQRAERSERQSNQREWDARARAYAADMRLVGESWNDSNHEAISTRLLPYVPTDGKGDLRGFEWWLYHGEMGNHPRRNESEIRSENVSAAPAVTMAELATLNQDTANIGRARRSLIMSADVSAAAINRDGTAIAVLTESAELDLLKFDDLTPLRQARLAAANQVFLAISPDATTVASISNGVPLRLHTSAKDPQIVEVPVMKSVTGIRYSPSGQYIIVVDQFEVIVVSTGSHAVAYRLPHRGTVCGAEFLDDETLMTLSSIGEICRWSLDEDARPQKDLLDLGDVVEFAVSPEAQCVAVRGSQRVLLYDLATLQISSTIPIRGETYGLCFLGRGKTLLTAEKPSKCRLWQTLTCQQMGDLDGIHPAHISVSSDGYRLVSYEGKTLTILDARPR